MSRIVESGPALTEMPLSRRDELIGQVLAFLVERGYTITAPCTTPPAKPASDPESEGTP